MRSRSFTTRCPKWRQSLAAQPRTSLSGISCHFPSLPDYTVAHLTAKEKHRFVDWFYTRHRYWFYTRHRYWFCTRHRYWFCTRHRYWFLQGTDTGFVQGTVYTMHRSYTEIIKTNTKYCIFWGVIPRRQNLTC
jgi:hypothetical protein